MNRNPQLLLAFIIKSSGPASLGHGSSIYDHDAKSGFVSSAAHDLAVVVEIGSFFACDFGWESAVFGDTDAGEESADFGLVAHWEDLLEALVGPG